jgi:tripartite-type tricarboxylate transporter receptor subunit TctC
VNGGLKRSLLAVLAVVAALAPSHADEYPSRQIEMIVPFAPGGGSGLVARMLSDGLAKRYGQAVVVINRPGGNTNIGTVSVVRAKPDGYTLGIASVGMTANPSLYKNLNYDPQTEIEPISLLANSPTVLVVPPSLPVNTLAEFIAYAKARPGELNYASYGAGSGPHMATELFQSLTGVKMVHVP